MKVDELNYKNGVFEDENEDFSENEKTENFDGEAKENKIEDEYREEDYVASRMARKQKRNTKIKRQHIFVKTFLVLFLIVGVLLTPVFNINYISVSGNSYLSKEQIIEASGLNKNSNIFVFQTKKAVSGLENLSFVDAAQVKRVFPTSVKIYVKECTPVAQISCGQSLYLVVDKKAKILDTASVTDKYDVPVISGIDVSEFEVGKKVKVENEKTFEKILLLSQEIGENSMTEDTQSIYAKDEDLYIKLKRGITCNLGQGDNLSYRIKFIKEVYKSIPEDKTGKLEFVEEYKAVFTEDEK